jgi:hypothetical protein
MWKPPLLALVLVLAVSASADKVKRPKAVSLVRIPDQTVDLVPAPDIVAQQACGNWARSAAIEAMLAAQGVALNQEFWAFRIDGGKMCFEDWGKPERLAKDVGGDYVLDDGSRVTLALSFAPGAPTSPDLLIQRLKQGRTLMLVWRGRPYMLSGVTYDEYVYPDGGRMYEFQELRLVDPQVRNEDERVVRFSKSKDALSELQGVLDVVSTRSTSQTWIREREQTREEQPWTPKRTEREPNRPWTPDGRPWNPQPEPEPKPPTAQPK